MESFLKKGTTNPSVNFQILDANWFSNAGQPAFRPGALRKQLCICLPCGFFHILVSKNFLFERCTRWPRSRTMQPENKCLTLALASFL